MRPAYLIQNLLQWNLHTLESGGIGNCYYWCLESVLCWEVICIVSFIRIECPFKRGSHCSQRIVLRPYAMCSTQRADVHIHIGCVLQAPAIQKLEGGVLHLGQNGGQLLLLSTLCSPAQHSCHVVTRAQWNHTHHTLEGKEEWRNKRSYLS